MLTGSDLGVENPSTAASHLDAAWPPLLIGVAVVARTGGRGFSWVANRHESGAPTAILHARRHRALDRPVLVLADAPVGFAIRADA
jgi:hypothetical protein